LFNAGHLFALFVMAESCHHTGSPEDRQPLPAVLTGPEAADTMP
jgi:hypothetical protein